MKIKTKSFSIAFASSLFILFLISSMVSTASAAPENLTVNFIDVGQGDSILLEYGDNDMLIDAGEIGKGDV